MRVAAQRMLSALPLLVGAGLAGCGLNKQAGAQVSVKACLSAAASQAFQSTVYPTLKANCAGCHNGSGPVPFAAPDTGTAYSAALTETNFSNITASPLVIYGGNGHCGSTLCSGLTSSLVTAITQWKAAQASLPPSANACGPTPGPTGPPSVGNPGQLATGWMAIPTALPTPPATTEMRFALDSVGPGLTGAVFSVQVTLFSPPAPGNPGAYRFSSPELATPTQTLHIANVGLVIQTASGKRVYPDFNLIDVVVAAKKFTPAANLPLPFPELTTSQPIVLQELPNGDQIGFTFNTLAPASLPSCKALSQFTQYAVPALQTNCTPCHTGSGGGTPFWSIGAGGSNASYCQQMLALISPQSPSTSVLLGVPHTGYGAMPVVNIPASDVANLLLWMGGEAQ